MRGSQALPRLHFHVANVLVRLRRFEAEANGYARVLRAWPDDAAARFQHAWCLLEVPSRRAEGIAAFQRLLESRPSASGFYPVLVGTLTAGGNLDEALAIARASAEAAPDEAAGHRALGAVHIKRGNGAAALAAFDRMSEILRPGQIRQLPGTWIRASAARAVALTLLDRHAEAMRLYDDVLAVDPTYFERWQELKPHYRRSLEAAGPQSPTAA